VKAAKDDIIVGMCGGIFVSPRVFPKKCPMSIKRERNVVSIDGRVPFYTGYL